MYQIDCNSYRSIKSFNRRVRFLVMHYTSIDFKMSVMALTGEAVSTHYLVLILRTNHILKQDLRICVSLIWLMKKNVLGMPV